MHAEPLEALCSRFDTDVVRGLPSSEVQKRLARDGANSLPEPKKKSAWRRFLAQFENPIVLTLLVAAVIALIEAADRAELGFLQRYGDAIAIFLIVALNAVLGYYQEQRAEAALDALQRMQTPTARVRRGDEVQSVEAAGVVVGDILELEAGDAIAADARVLQSIDLAAEESALTGESVPVGKDARATIADDAPMGDRANMLYVGTSVVRGKGRALVVATGARTELGKLNALIQKSGEDRSTPLDDKLQTFAKQILWGCLALSALLFARGMFKGDRSWRELLLEAVSLAVAAIPEGLPAITTITLALGVQRMARRGAIVRKLSAVETLGAATIICSDKTGTLTQNEMTVRAVFADGHEYSVTGVGYGPKGDILSPDGAVIPVPEGVLRDVLATAALCNNARLEPSEAGFRVIGDPTEGALLALAAKAGVPRESFSPRLQILHELPFDSDRKRMTVVTLDEAGREVAHTKGSADVLLPRCAKVMTAAGAVDLDETTRARIGAVADGMSAKALRVLGFARRDLAPGTVPTGDAQKDRRVIDLEEELTFLGLVAMIDPPRDGVKEAIASCVEAGVQVVMITGDHKLTAIAISQELGLWAPGDLALTGAELAKMTPKALQDATVHGRVYARVTAEQKLRIVEAMKARGEIVAMTGDGVNDAPALREAHIGVAMGKGGTDVAREAADLVIADDNFVTIVEAVREGRAIYRNIQKFIYFLLSSNAGLVVAVFVASFLTGPLPLTPLMILWINLVTNGLPALALGIDPPDPTQMREPPHQAGRGLLGRREVVSMAVVGVAMGAAAIACYFWPWQTDGSAEQARAVAFSLLALSPLVHAWNSRSPTASVFVLRPFFPRPLVLAVALSAGIHFVAVFVPSLQPVFRTFPLNHEQWVVLLLLSFSIVPVVELLKLVERSAFRRAAR